MPTLLMLLDFIPDQQRTFETFLLRLSHALRIEGWQIVFVFSGEPSDAFAAQLRSEGAEYRVFTFPLQRLTFEALIASLAGLSPLSMANSFVSCFSPFILQIKKRLGIKYWLVLDESSGIASSKSGIKRLAAVLRGKYYGIHINRILAVSELVARRNIEQSFLPPSRVKVLHNGVDLSRFRPSVHIGTKMDEPLVVFIGQLIPEKGVRTLLKAIMLLKLRHVPITPMVEIAGRGILEDELQAFTIENGLDRVKFLGQVVDVPALYQAATVVVVPSEWAEAFGLVVAEAMACGACVLASDAGSIPDVVGRDEEGGRLFRSGDANDLAEKLCALLGDQEAQDRYRRQARARAERLFGLDAMVSGFVKELHDVTKGS